jgi:hypothetical protein
MSPEWEQRGWNSFLWDGRDERPGASIDAGTAGAAVRADSGAGFGRRGRHHFQGFNNRA